MKFIMILLPVLLTGCAARPVPPGGGGSLLSGVETQVAAVTRQAMDGDPGARVLYARWLADTGSTAQAREVLSPLADQGDREAQYRLGCLLMADRTPDSRRQAVDRMTRAATAGLAVAQRTLGDWLLNGSAGTRDPAAALVWYRKAAEQGDAAAQNAVGAALSAGRGTARDRTAALVWYRKAAEQGNALAALNTGNAYWTGSGVRANAGVAMAWYVLAEHNARPAESAVRRLAQQMRVRAMMLSATRGRLSAARALAEQYLRRYGRPGVPVTPLPGGA
ncbi:sel1 repeat family protein [Salmonella enterica]|nr:sel1 repeat family protein [Salmonella enterica]EBT2123489.1 sel1 repeat family protein [Salmonella enterica]